MFRCPAGWNSIPVRTGNDGKLTAIVDFAHNRLSFEKLYDSVLREYPEHRIYTVFGCPYTFIESRERAIWTAVACAAAGSGKALVLILGKGHETSQKIGGKVYAYPSGGVLAKKRCGTMMSDKNGCQKMPEKFIIKRRHF